MRLSASICESDCTGNAGIHRPHPTAGCRCRRRCSQSDIDHTLLSSGTAADAANFCSTCAHHRSSIENSRRPSAARREPARADHEQANCSSDRSRGSGGGRAELEARMRSLKDARTSQTGQQLREPARQGRRTASGHAGGPLRWRRGPWTGPHPEPTGRWRCARSRRRCSVHRENRNGAGQVTKRGFNGAHTLTHTQQHDSRSERPQR